MSENGCFVLLVMMVFFGVVVGVGVVSIIDEIVRVFPTCAEQTCGHDKMRHFMFFRKTRHVHVGPKFEVNVHGMSQSFSPSRVRTTVLCPHNRKMNNEFEKSYCSLVGTTFSL